jgi:hypothetical protein
MALSFIIPDLELNTKLTRALIILNNLSFNKAGNPVLTTEKIAVCDFFLQHPYILHGVLRGQGKKNFDLRPEESTSINREYPNTSGLSQYKELRITLQILLFHGYLAASLTPDAEAVYTITEPGAEFINSVQAAYVSRLDEIAKPIGQIISQNYRQLMVSIKPYTNGK